MTRRPKKQERRRLETLLPDLILLVERRRCSEKRRSMKVKDFLTDEQVELEIARLQASPHVKLAKKEEQIRYRRRQYMYTLRAYEKKGRRMAEEGWTLDMLESMEQCPNAR